MPKVHRPRSIWPYTLVILLVASLVALGVYLLAVRDTEEISPTPPPASQTEQPAPEPEPEEPEFPFIDLQPTVNAWAKAQRGSAGVVIYDLANDKSAARHQADKEYFTASIYKLYVAYIGYQKVADGTYKLSDPYLNGWTRGKCLDEMIRTSHSPCAEKMWGELGKEALTAKLKTYGLAHTSMTGLVTSAGDAAIILQRLHQRKDLTEKHTALLLDSMKEQIYRDALPKGFSGATVFDKVGFRELVEYHDVSIVTLKNGRSYVVSILTSNVGTRAIVTLAQSVLAKTR